MIWIRKSLHVFAFVGWMAAVPAFSAEQEPKVSVAGLMVVFDSLAEEFDGFTTFNKETGVHLLLALRSGERHIVTIDSDRSKISSVADDLGNQLTGKVGMFSQISDDAKIAKIEVATKELPAAGSTAITLKGTLAVTLAGERSEIAAAATTLAPKAKLEFGERLVLTVAKAGKPEWGDAEWEIEFQASRELQDLLELRFADQAGNPLEANNSGSSTMKMLGRVTATKTWTFETMPEGKISVTALMWDDLEEVIVPVEFELGVAG